jgi:prepilin-type N-terminal cleavage/methylation domain-containing protein
MPQGRQLRHTSARCRNAGFTLIELVVAMAIFSLVLFAATIALNQTFTIGLRNRRRSEAQEDLSGALEQIARQLRQAGTIVVPARSSTSSITSPGAGGAILEFAQQLADGSIRTVSYGAAVPTDPAEVISPVAGIPNYQVMVKWGATSTSQPLTGQNVTSFTVERPAWSNNVVIVTLESVQVETSGTKASPLRVTTLVALRQ